MSSNSPPPFQGFEEPPSSLSSPTWPERLRALIEQHPGKWAKYGPYSSERTAQNTASRVSSNYVRHFPGWTVHSKVHVESASIGGRVVWLYLRARKTEEQT